MLLPFRAASRFCLPVSFLFFIDFPVYPPTAGRFRRKRNFPDFRLQLQFQKTPFAKRSRYNQESILTAGFTDGSMRLHVFHTRLAESKFQGYRLIRFHLQAGPWLFGEFRLQTEGCLWFLQMQFGRHKHVQKNPALLLKPDIFLKLCRRFHSASRAAPEIPVRAAEFFSAVRPHRLMILGQSRFSAECIQHRIVFQAFQMFQILQPVFRVIPEQIFQNLFRIVRTAAFAFPSGQVRTVQPVRSPVLRLFRYSAP